MSETLTIPQMEAHVVAKSVEDASFRQALIADAKATVEKEFNVTLPSHIKINAIVSPANTMTLVLPHVQTTGTDGEMNDEDLESVAGGSKSGAKSFFNGLGYGISGGHLGKTDNSKENLAGAITGVVIRSL